MLIESFQLIKHIVQMSDQCKVHSLEEDLLQVDKRKETQELTYNITKDMKLCFTSYIVPSPAK